MRTVSFSNPETGKLFNNRFINANTNTFGDPTSGLSIRHRPSDPPGHCVRGNGRQNVQTIFMTPKGEIFHVATGFLSGEDLVEEGEFAFGLFNVIDELEPQEAKVQVANAHRKRLANLGLQETDRSSRFAGMGAVMHNVPMNVGNESGNRNVNSLFKRFQQTQIQSDNQFMIDNPMLTRQELESDPTRLIGNGKSFFASSSGGS